MKRVEFYVGTKYTETFGNGKAEQWEFDKTMACNHVERILHAMFHVDGFSYHWITGYWKGEKEDTIHIILFTELAHCILDAIATELRDALYQESVLLTVNDEQYFI